MTPIGPILLARRHTLGWTLSELSAATMQFGKPVGPGVLSAIEHSKRDVTLSTLTRIMQALGLDWSDLG